MKQILIITVTVVLLVGIAVFAVRRSMKKSGCGCSDCDQCDIDHGCDTDNAQNKEK